MTLSPFVILKGLLLGLGAAVPIGPVNVEIARRVLRRGFADGFALGCGAVSVDLTYAVLSALGIRMVLRSPAISLSLSVAGVLLLTALGLLSLRAAAQDRGDPAGEAPPVRTAVHGAYFTGLLMTFLNPLTLAFWFVAVPATVGSITTRPAHDLPMLCAGVFVGTIGWVTFFCTLLSVAGRFRRPWWTAAADIAGGLTLIGFAVAATVHLIRATR